MTTHKTEYCDWNNISQCTAVLSSSIKKTLPEYRAQPTSMKKITVTIQECVCVYYYFTVALFLLFSV